MSAKNYENRLTHVNVTSKDTVDPFYRDVVCLFTAANRSGNARLQQPAAKTCSDDRVDADLVSSDLSVDKNKNVERENGNYNNDDDNDDDDDDDDDDADDDDDDDGDRRGGGDVCDAVSRESYQPSSQEAGEPKRADQQLTDASGTVAPTDDKLHQSANLTPKEIYREQASLLQSSSFFFFFFFFFW